MDPTLQQIPQGNTPPDNEPLDTGDAPMRILDIIRANIPDASAPAAAPQAPAGKPSPAPQKEDAVPTLEELGGHLTGETNTIDAIPKPGEPAMHSAPAKTKPEMAVYKLAPMDDPRDVARGALPDASGMTVPPPAPSALAGIDMGAIQLAPEEPKAPRTVSTSLAPERTAEAADDMAARPAGKPEYIIPSVHTLRDDMKSIVRDQSMSIVRASVLEEEKRHQRSPDSATTSTDMAAGNASAKKQRGISGILIAALVLFVLGGALGGGFLWYRASQQAPIAGASQTPSIIFAEQSGTLSISNSSPTIIATALGQMRSANSMSPSSITRIIPTITTDTAIGSSAKTRIATASEFFDALHAQVPAALDGALGSDFFLGIHAVDGNQVLLILPVTSYENAYAGMLAWEPTMGASLFALFTPAPATITAADGSLNANAFADIVIKNYDVRMQSDASGNPRLLYSFPNRKYLIITSSPYTFTEALARLQAANQL